MTVKILDFLKNEWSNWLLARIAAVRTIDKQYSHSTQDENRAYQYPIIIFKLVFLL